MPGPEKNVTRSSKKDLLLLEQILQDLDTRTSQEPPTRAFIQAPLRHGICKIFTQGPQTKDLTRRTSPGSPQDLLTRTWKRWKRSCKDQGRDNRFVRASAVKTHMDMSQERFYARIYRKMTRPKLVPRASLRGRHAHGHVTRATLCKNLQEKAGEQMEHPDQALALTLAVSCNTNTAPHEAGGGRCFLIGANKVLPLGFA